MRLLRRVLARIDENLTDFDQPLTVVIPQPRSVSPDELISRHLAQRGYHLVEEVGSWDCCECCRAYSQEPCPAIHRRPCDRHQSGDAA